MTAGLPIDGPILVGAALLVVGALVVGMSDRLRLPASILSLAIGMVVGSDVLGLIYVDDAALVRDLSVIALVVILFEGGLTTKPSALREAGLPGFVLSNLGVLITAGVTAVGAQLILQIGWQTALLMGAVVASTDAAVVFDLVRRAPMPRRLASIVEVESGANDPFAIVLTIGLIVAWQETTTAADWVVFGLTQLLGGAVVGGVIGLVGVGILRLRLRSQGLYPLLATGVAGLAYATAAAVGASGFLSVYIAGLVVGALVTRQRQVIRSFHLSLANAADLILFLLLGLLVFPAQLPAVAIPALAVTAVLLLVARPLAVAVSLLPFRFSWREQVLISWAGLRGAVPIVLATFPATAGVPGGNAIFNVVFFVVVTSTLVQGTTVVPLIRALGLEASRPAWQSVAEALPLDDPEIDLVEVHVTKDLPLVGARLADVPLGPGMLVTAVVRGDRVLVPTGETLFYSGDLVLLSIDRDRADVHDATRWARGEREKA